MDLCEWRWRCGRTTRASSRQHTRNCTAFVAGAPHCHDRRAFKQLRAQHNVRLRSLLPCAFVSCLGVTELSSVVQVKQPAGTIDLVRRRRHVDMQVHGTAENKKVRQGQRCVQGFAVEVLDCVAYSWVESVPMWVCRPALRNMPAGLQPNSVPGWWWPPCMLLLGMPAQLLMLVPVLVLCCCVIGAGAGADQLQLS